MSDTEDDTEYNPDRNKSEEDESSDEECSGYCHIQVGGGPATPL